jgi:two-component system chemotaxis response regulator CheB
MPSKAIKAGAVKDICHLNDISQYIIDFSSNKRK